VPNTHAWLLTCCKVHHVTGLKNTIRRRRSAVQMIFSQDSPSPSWKLECTEVVVIQSTNSIIPYTCSSWSGGTSGSCSSAAFDVLSMPHNPGDFIGTSEAFFRAAKALFPSPLLPKQMVSPRPCQTPHWTLFISKVLPSWHRVQQGHMRWRTQSSRLLSVPRMLNCFLILLRK